MSNTSMESRFPAKHGKIRPDNIKIAGVYLDNEFWEEILDLLKSKDLLNEAMILQLAQLRENLEFANSNMFKLEKSYTELKHTTILSTILCMGLCASIVYFF